MTRLAVFDSTGSPVPPERIAAIRQGQGDAPDPAYRAGGWRGQEFAAWMPAPTSADSAVLPNRDLTVARTRDVVRNDPTAQSGVSRLVEMLVGAKLTLSSKPDARALGLDRTDKAHRKILRDLAGSIESEWYQFGNDPQRRCDAQRRLTINGIFRLLARTFATMNETTSCLKWKPGGRYSTCVLAIDPDRLSNPNGLPTTQKLRGGIEFDEDGAPIAGHIRNGHPADWYIVPPPMTWTRIPFRTPSGRPVLIHGFEPEREDQARAMTPFAALVKRLHMIGKFSDTELASATVNALFAAFVKSSLPVGEATAAFTPQTVLTMEGKRLDYWTKNPAHVGGVRIPVMPIGDEIQINSSPRQTTAFNDFQKAFLQSIAAALGISYQQLSGDWESINYSSARAALNEVWRHIQMLFAVFVDQVVAPIHYAQLEEAFDRGYIKPPPGAPDFWDMPGAYLRARWIGPGRGYVDPVKEAQGASLRMGNMTSTLEDECADLGRDLEDTLDQIADEEEMLADRRLTRTLSAGSGLLADPSDAGNDPEQDKRANA
ncbi:phage portal protein [Bradyrhizobium tropiciagri]|uniref:phage portal protein n=1 Tax=Bradyrhizobium tropiciagri TaxID=312253 RepID=UPI001BACD705|nr:phage portal protein [Bradyrhizobium tropiciagri]MBR0871190.1 phage portal protein [Bradyrhizobium tropiciagri]